jgi:hypothetical protein
VRVRQASSSTKNKNVGQLFYLLGKRLIRFEQFDGTTLLPFKSNGRFHVGGKVVVTPLQSLHKNCGKCYPNNKSSRR